MIEEDIEDLQRRVRMLERKLLLIERPEKRLSEIDKEYLKRR